MAFELRNMTFQGANLLDNAADAQQSKLWIAGQIVSDMQSMKSLALNQIAVLHRARDLIDGEIARLTLLYHQAEQAQH